MIRALGWLLLSLAAVFPIAWSAMIIVGFFHAEFLPVLIPAGYWPCFVLVMCFWLNSFVAASIRVWQKDGSS